MLHCAVCDDDPKVVAVLQEMIAAYPGDLLSTGFLDPLDLLSAICNGQKFDLYILDIIMPTMIGIDLAEEIRKDDRDCIIIFLTSSDEFYRDAFSVDALQYLDKPVEEASLYHTFDRALRYIENNRDEILPVQTKTGFYALHINQIVYAESFRHVITFHLCDGSSVDTLDSSLTLKRLTELLHFPPFSAPYRVFIINLSYVDCLNKREFYMTNGSVIPIPQKQFSKVRQEYSDYLLTRYTKGDH